MSPPDSSVYFHSVNFVSCVLGVFFGLLRLFYKIVSRRLKAACRRGLHGLRHHPACSAVMRGRKAPCYHRPPQKEAWQDWDGGAAAYKRPAGHRRGQQRSMHAPFFFFFFEETTIIDLLEKAGDVVFAAG